MKGDIIIVEEHHIRVAKIIVSRIKANIKMDTRYTISVAGESGSGKSETAKALAQVFEKEGMKSFVFQQDDYFLYPPKTNDLTRRKDIGWVGPKEVNLKKLDEDLKQAIDGKPEVIKPLVLYQDDKIENEVIQLEGTNVIIAEGTYTSLLQNIDTKVFINRNRLETLESRKKRGREPIEPFIEEVLKIEHEIISKHKEYADIIITKDYNVEFR